MPRHPRPAPMRANREHRDIGLIPRGPSRIQPPLPPSGLLPASRASWTAYWSSPLARAAVPETDLPALSRLWSLYDERARVYRGIRLSRMVRGVAGQPRANPLYGALASLDSAIERLEDRFGLSPRARLQLGVILGDAARSLADLNDELEAGEDLDALLDVDGTAG